MKKKHKYIYNTYTTSIHRVVRKSIRPPLDPPPLRMSATPKCPRPPNKPKHQSKMTQANTKTQFPNEGLHQRGRKIVPTHTAPRKKQPPPKPTNRPGHPQQQQPQSNARDNPQQVPHSAAEEPPGPPIPTESLQPSHTVGPPSMNRPPTPQYLNRTQARTPTRPFQSPHPAPLQPPRGGPAGVPRTTAPPQNPSPLQLEATNIRPDTPPPQDPPANSRTHGPIHHSKSNRDSPTAKYGGGSATVRGCPAAPGPGRPEATNGTANSTVHQQIRSEPRPRSRAMIQKHTSKSTPERPQKNKMKTPERPSQSPDPNPTETPQHDPKKAAHGRKKPPMRPNHNSSAKTSGPRTL